MGIKTFFEPDKRKLVLFTLFFIVAYFGMVQTWAFCKECSPKPLLYDAIKAFPFWGLWVYLSLPIQIVFAFIPLQGVALLLTNLPYFYAVSCFMVYSFERYEKNFSRNVIGFWGILFVALNLYNLVVIPWIASASGEQILVSATQPPFLETIGFYFVEFISFVFYAYLVSSIYFATKNKLKKSHSQSASPAKFSS